jgi:hypothetical protein
MAGDGWGFDGCVDVLARAFFWIELLIMSLFFMYELLLGRCM